MVKIKEHLKYFGLDALECLTAVSLPLYLIDAGVQAFEKNISFVKQLKDANNLENLVCLAGGAILYGGIKTAIKLYKSNKNKKTVLH